MNMTPELAYFLKINVAIALFYAFYRLFFYKDTFFPWRRASLLCFYIISLLYPLANIQNWVKEHEPMVAIADIYATTLLPEYTLKATPQEVPTDWNEIILSASTAIYLIGMALLSIRLIIQLISLIRLHIRCKKIEVFGIRIHLLDQKISPFSFFHWIFIHPKSHTETELSEILTHEMTHTRQYHSIDVILSELMCIFCWFNPFVWLMKREVRNNLEFMADRKVLETGYDSKEYQYHLLGLTHHKAAAKISNSFNVLPLKNRIKMMNKRRTRKIGKTKYAMFIPLAALLMIISNIEVVARTTKNIVEETFSSSSLQKQATIADSHTLPAETDTIITKSAKSASETPPEILPTFPGGLKALMSYLSDNIQYSESAIQKNITGRVYVQFTVDKDGTIANPTVLRGVSPELDSEAIRVVKSMPKWVPGKNKGEIVATKYVLPITFKATSTSKDKKTQGKDLKVKRAELEEVIVVSHLPQTSTEPEIQNEVEEMPQYPGGKVELMTYLRKAIKYPTLAIKNKEEGRVIIQMIIGTDGSISDVSVLKSVSPALDAEAIRIVSQMPKWEPGKDKGKTVAVECTLPILFKLQ